MSLPDAWLSLPAAVLPEERLDNEAVLARMRAAFQGDEGDWESLMRHTRFLFRLCGSRHRYLFRDADEALAAAVAAVERVLAEQGRAAEELEVLVYGAIAREYLEPATAAEIGARIGRPRLLAYDVSAACGSGLLGVQDVVARMALDESLRLGVVSTLSATLGHVSYALPDATALETLGAGLTVGNASTAMLVSRDRPRLGGRIRAMGAESFSEHYGICQAPVHGPFRSQSIELFAAMRAYVPGHLKATCARAGWDPREVDLWVLHQASDRILKELAELTGVEVERVLRVHGRYGNADASSAPLTLRHAADEGLLRPGMKVMVGSGAAGIFLATLALDWEP